MGGGFGISGNKKNNKA